MVKAGDSFFTLFALNALSVGVGQAAVCYLLGVPLIFIVDRIQVRIKTHVDIEQ